MCKNALRAFPNSAHARLYPANSLNYDWALNMVNKYYQNSIYPCTVLHWLKGFYSVVPRIKLLAAEIATPPPKKKLLKQPGKVGVFFWGGGRFKGNFSILNLSYFIIISWIKKRSKMFYFSLVVYIFPRITLLWTTCIVFLDYWSPETKS